MSKTRNLGNLSDFLTAGSTYVTTTTPPQFDNSTNLATTGFVQRAYGSLGSTALVLTGNTTLTTSQSGTIFEILGTGAAPVITLPAATAQTLVSYTIVNAGTSYGFSITSASNIYLNGATNTTWALPIGSMIQVFSDGASWIVVNMGGVSTTAPQFDNSARNATTSFVQKALGNYAGFATVTSSRSLTANDIGASLWPNANGYTLTLPAPSTLSVPLGSGFQVFCTSFSMTLSGSIQGSGGAAVSPFTVGTGQSLYLIAASSSTWQITNSVADLGNNVAFGSSVNTPGYQKLPSGLIVQWGSLNASSSADVAVTFPIAFTTAVYSVNVSTSATSGSGGFANYNNPATTGFNLGCYLYNGSRAGYGCSWYAVGK